MTPSTWLPDPSHYPEQMTPLSATTWFEAVGRGLHDAMRELGGPFGGFEARTELGWAYEGELPTEWEHDPEAFRAAALGLADRWDRDLRPRCHAISDEIHTLRPDRPPPAEAVGVLDHLWDLVREQWTIHFLVVIPAQVAVELFHDAYREALGDEDPLAPYRLLDGVPNETNEADAELWSLALRARQLGVDDLITELLTDAALQRLSEVRQGRRFVDDLRRYLDRFGGRSRWHEVSLPREAESPEMTFESLRLLLEAGRPPLLAAAQDAPSRERDILAAAPALRELVDAAKVGYALKESHAYHIDYPGLLALRETMLGFGRRLASEGRLRDRDDVWMLRREELRAAIDERWHADRIAGVVTERRAELAAGRREGPQPYLGEEPPPVERHAVLAKFYGTPSSVAANGEVVGIGASPGSARGPARVVAAAQDFARVQPGDVLVTTTTTPAWTPLFPSISALVTETGGVLSHAAIVAREYGVPAVVGADGATHLLPDGAIVEVDGTTGRVRVL